MNRDPNCGRLLSNRYELVDLVGEGAMGRVYRAKDTLLGGVTVAIKFLSQTLLNKNMRDRFEKEATISALLGEKSIHVVRVRDYGIDEHNISFYVMEFLSGKSLSDLIRHQPLPLSRFLTLTRHICLGLASAHQGIMFNGERCTIIHRDIKPSNILVIQDPTVGELAKILDFGIAKLIQSGGSQTQSFMGTLAYCSPEQMEGKELDRRSDIYSLGVMMYEMLTTEMPLLPQNSSFGGWYQAHHEFKPESFNPNLDIPEELKNLVMRCLEKEKKQRPQSVRDILKVLETLQQSSQEFSSKAQEATVRISPQPIPSHHALISATTEPENTLKAVPSVTETCLQQSWPEDKPIKKIVFADLLTTPRGKISSLCVMLDYQDIIDRMTCSRYNQFLFINHPHPVLLWITLLYHPQYKPRWLPCYLDLKTNKGQQISRNLSELGSYRILFFSLNEPKQCRNVMSSTISPQNQGMLKQWADISQITKGSGHPQMAKQMLKQELENLKPKILLKMEAINPEYSGNISG
ncbi:MAG: serine/threonine-protein kinase [Xenococcaceae cyanobacterium MO_188.B32]|nr:serine/threonine-protein kinase [Xenococcaceae cyanobacterium MO_188.B32]